MDNIKAFFKSDRWILLLGLMPLAFGIIGSWVHDRRISDRLEKLEQQPTAVAPLAESQLEELGPSVLAQLPGFDAATQQQMDTDNEITRLKITVEKLERDLRRLNQVVFKVAELRIGDAPPEPAEEE